MEGVEGMDIVDVMESAGIEEGIESVPKMKNMENTKNQYSFVNYAHRGASHYAPENTLQAFYEGIRLGATGIETDVQLSQDCVPILFHDETLDRVCGVSGTVGAWSLAELKKLFVAKPTEPTTSGQPPRHYSLGPDRICTLAEFLEHFSFRERTLAIEFKMDKAELDEKVLELIRLYDVEDQVILTSFNPVILVRLSARFQTGGFTSRVRLGYLVRRWSPEVRAFAEQYHIGQICLSAECLTDEVVREVHSLNYSVRAWGVTSEELMHKVIALGVDGGMTINFPDVLAGAMRV